MTVASCASTVKRSEFPTAKAAMRPRKRRTNVVRGQLVASRERVTSSEAGHRRSYFGQKCACVQGWQSATPKERYRESVSKEDPDTRLL
eukprot:scaffold13830_cov78-Skeletonema_dohrnii-CCMP3373.AAC.1